MARKWKGLRKLVEECAELTVELMKLEEFPSGKHPGRRRNLKVSVEEECADVLNALLFYIDINKLDQVKIGKRMRVKRRKFIEWMGDPKDRKIKTVKKSPKTKNQTSNAS